MTLRSGPLLHMAGYSSHQGTGFSLLKYRWYYESVQNYWNKMQYWRTGLATSESDTFFPDGVGQVWFAPRWYFTSLAVGKSSDSTPENSLRIALMGF